MPDPLMIILLLASYFAPLFVGLPIVFLHRSNGNDGIAIWVLVGVSGFVCAHTQISKSILENPNQFVLATVTFVTASIFILSIFLASFKLKDIDKYWMRLIAFMCLMIQVPIGFAGIAQAVEGQDDYMNVPQYIAEFVWRFVDTVCFGTLSNHNLSGYSDMVILTQTGSITVILFNFVVGSFLLSSIWGLILSPIWEQISYTIRGKH